MSMKIMFFQLFQEIRYNFDIILVKNLDINQNNA